MTLTNGTLLGPYRIVGAIGEGGMGEVYRAVDTRLDRSVAIKVIPSRFTNRPEVRERFEREARAISALNHPNICTLYDVGSQDGIEFIVMEYLEGESLAARLARGPLPLDQAVRYAAEIASALEKAHTHGIVHRDLKPGNVMLTKTGAKLLDFGLAKLQRPESGSVFQQSSLPTKASNLTADGTILGTIQYMAPEQLEGKEADERSDLFAFGAMLYEMVTGRKAFDGKTQVSLMAAIIHVEPPPLTALMPASPPALDHIIKGCLAKNPDERWRSFHDVLMNLRWLSEPGGSSGSSAAIPASPPRKRGKFQAVGIAAVVILIVAAGLIAYRLKPAAPAETARFTILAPPGNSFRSLYVSPDGSRATADPWPSLSPDGKRLAFVARGADGKLKIWIRPLNSLTAQLLSGTDNGILPFWSPDGKNIGFFADGVLKKIDTVGGAAQMLCDAPTEGGISGTWGDNAILFKFHNTIYRVSPAGGQPVQVTTLDVSRKEAAHNKPFFLPDGRHFLFNVSSSQKESQGIYVGSIDSKETKRLVSVNSEAKFSAGYLVYQRSSVLTAQLLDLKSLTLTGDPFPIADHVAGSPAGANGTTAFSVSSSGALAYRAGDPTNDALVWLDRTGKTVGTIGGNERYGSLSLSPDGRVLAVERRADADDIWLYDSVRETVSRLTFDPARENYPLWSADGKRVFFYSSRTGLAQIFAKNSDGTGQDERILETANNSLPIAVSRDGKYLLYRYDDPKTKEDLWLLPLTGNGKPKPIVHTAFNESDGDISPDGRWLAYLSDESGRSEVYVQPLAGSSGRWQISNTSGGGWSPEWSADGKELFYLTSNGDLMVSVISPGQTFQNGVPRKLFFAEGVDIANNRPFSVTPDGQRFIFSLFSESNANWEITVVTNWTADLKK